MAFGIDGNNIVGRYYDGGGYHGFLYDGSTWTTLDGPGAWTFPAGIDGDNIVGSLYLGPSVSYGFIANSVTIPGPAPVPEPVSLVSGAIGLACVGAYVRRRRRTR
jgi:hypothetical protein